MKKVLFSIILFCMAFEFSNAQHQAARVIRDSLANKFPGAQNISWSPRGNSEVATFYRNSRRHEVTYNNSGNWQRIERESLRDSLRPNVNGVLSKEYPGFQTKSVTRVIVRGKAPYSEVTLQKATLTRKVEIDDNGKILKSE